MKGIDEIEKLVDLVAASGIQELTARMGERRITITGGRPELKSNPLTPQHVSPISDPLTMIACAADPPTTYHITAPMVGVFHHAAPAITVGAQVESGQVIAIIESMKLMNDIRSEVTGVVTKMHVDDGLAVEYGQPLFEIEPAPSEDDDE
jgi:acetyl-CoA carboxylase biotin carboxyl carrier protein